MTINAELRTSTEGLKALVGELATSTDTILQIVNQHQDNFMVLYQCAASYKLYISDELHINFILVTEVRDIRADIRRILDRLDR